MQWWRPVFIILITARTVFVSAAEKTPSEFFLAQLNETDAPSLSRREPVDPSAIATSSQSIHAGKSKEQLLSELKDITTPAAPVWWPPAPGWWVVFLLLIAMLGVAIQWIRSLLKRRRKNNWKKTAILRHRQLCDQARDLNVSSISIIADASVLLRRVTLTQLPREQIASRTDDQWLAVLDKIGQTNEYSQGAGRLLTRHPYMRPQDLDRSEIDALLKLIKTTIDRAPNAVIYQDGSQYQARLLSKESGIV